MIIKTLYNIKTNFNEINKILNMTNYSSKIIYPNPIKSIGEIIQTKYMNVNLMTLYCIHELNKIN